MKNAIPNNVLEAAAEIKLLDERRKEIETIFGWAAVFWSKVAVGGPDDCWPWLALSSAAREYGCSLNAIKWRLDRKKSGYRYL